MITTVTFKVLTFCTLVVLTVTSSANDECSICYEELDPTSPYKGGVCTLPCKHKFHVDDLKKTYEINLLSYTGGPNAEPRCPLCRLVVNPDIHVRPDAPVAVAPAPVPRNSTAGVTDNGFTTRWITDSGFDQADMNTAILQSIQDQRKTPEHLAFTTRSGTWITDSGFDQAQMDTAILGDIKYNGDLAKAIAMSLETPESEDEQKELEASLFSEDEQKELDAIDASPFFPRYLDAWRLDHPEAFREHEQKEQDAFREYDQKEREALRVHDQKELEAFLVHDQNPEEGLRLCQQNRRDYERKLQEARRNYDMQQLS